MFRYALVIAVASMALGLSGPANAAGDSDAGKAKAAKCASCHGSNGEGKKDNPPLAGMAEAAHVKALQEYKDGTRDHKVMQRFTKKLSDQDMADLAAYYAALK